MLRVLPLAEVLGKIGRENALVSTKTLGHNVGLDKVSEALKSVIKVIKGGAIDIVAVVYHKVSACAGNSLIADLQSVIVFLDDLITHDLGGKGHRYIYALVS